MHRKRAYVLQKSRNVCDTRFIPRTFAAEKFRRAKAKLPALRKGNEPLSLNQKEKRK